MPCTSPIFCLNSFPLSYHCNCPRSPCVAAITPRLGIWPRIDATPFFLAAVLFPFLNSRIIMLLLPRASPLFAPSQPCSYFDVAVASSASRHTIGFADISLFPSGSFARPKSNRVGEMRTLALSMASVSPLIYCSLYIGSMRTNQPLPVDHVVPDDRKKKRLFSSSCTGSFVLEPSDFDASPSDLFHVLRLKLDDLRQRRLYFDLTLFPYFSHFRRYGR